MNRKRRNDHKSILFIREQDPDTLYQERRYADPPRQMPLKDWIKRLARVHRHSRPAAIQMFEARFGELEAPPLFKAIRFLNRMYHYRRTGFISPVLMLPPWTHQLFPVLQSITK
jgi:hypothetical protein